MYTIDFETEAIVFGSKTLPKPVGLAVRDPEGVCRYYAFGHPTENNSDEKSVGILLESIWHEPIIGYNSDQFDFQVAEQYFGLPPRDPHLNFDVMFMAYLRDPHAPSLKLKDLAASWLGMPPDSQTELNQWILANVPECKTLKQCGEFICKAPGDLVGRYAMDDVKMTYALYEYLKESMEEQQEPLRREAKLAPILAGIQRGGIHINVDRLRQDHTQCREKLMVIDHMIRKHLSAPQLNPGSDRELATSLKRAGYSGFLTTPGGKDSVSKPSLEKVLAADPKLQSMLYTRATYDTLVGTFMEPWLRMADMNGGSIHPSYNQVRNPEGYGTRTGRLSSSNPNGQNIPTEFTKHDYWDDPFPLMRSYCLPDPGTVWYSIDFKAQEPRLTAHFEDGVLMKAFIDNPDLDPYIFVMELVGGDVTRKDSKVILLGLIYAMGAAALAEKLGCDIARATALRNAIKAALPDVVALDASCKKRFQYGLPIRTLGGRLVFREPPSNGRDWSYKALNLLIQGSAADQTKEAIIHAHHMLAEQDFYSRLLGTVHDEINLCAPETHRGVVMDIMHEAANWLPCDVPMRITMGVGSNWAEASKG